MNSRTELSARPPRPRRRLSWTNLLGALAMLSAAILSAGHARADSFCLPCVDKRWDSVETDMRQRARNLVRAREQQQKAENTHDSDLIAAADANLKKRQAEWDQIGETCEVLAGDGYKAFLVRQVTLKDAEYDEARDVAAKKAVILDRLRKAQADEREKLLLDMKGTIQQEAQQRANLGMNGLITGMRALILDGEKQLEELAKRPGSAQDAQALSTKLSLLKKLVPKAPASDRPDVDKIMKEAQGLVETLAKGSRFEKVAGAAPPLLRITLDAAAIAQSHLEWQRASMRLQENIDAENLWRSDLDIAQAVVKQLDAERKVAGEQVTRQAAFEKQLQMIHSELPK